MPDITTTLEYYKDLLAYQWVGQPNARGTVGVVVNAALCDLLPVDIQLGYDIDSAVGPQLDVLGEYIGFNRVIKGTIPRDYFTFDDYVSPDTSAIGMTDYTDALANAESVTWKYAYLSEAASSLDDEEYRVMLKLKLIQNGMSSTLGAIQQVLYDFFGTQIIAFDLRNMTMSYLASTTLSRIAKIAVGQGLLPKPIGVDFDGTFEAPDPAAVFGMQDCEAVETSPVGFSDCETGTVAEYWLDYNDKI